MRTLTVTYMYGYAVFFVGDSLGTFATDSKLITIKPGYGRKNMTNQSGILVYIIVHLYAEAYVDRYMYGREHNTSIYCVGKLHSSLLISSLVNAYEYFISKAIISKSETLEATSYK